MKMVAGFTRGLMILGMLWATQAWAGLQPTYVSCDPGQPNKNGPTCSNYWSVFHAPVDFNSLIGYVDQTPVPGTTPVYLTCVLNPPVPKAQPSCSNRWYISGSANTPFADFIGYTYTSQIPGTVPMYLTCNLAPPVPKAQPSCQNSWYVTQNPNPAAAAFTSFIGYVYYDAPISLYTFSPKYYIGSVIYVPPGQGPSSIKYGAGTVTGTTVSTEETWSNSTQFTISADEKNSQGVTTSSASISIGHGFGGSTGTSLDVQRTSNASTTYQGPGSNVINHDYDQILIYLGVKFVARVDYLGTINWSVDFSQIASQGYAETGYPIPVGCLRANSTLPPGQCDAIINFLSSAGITAADYPGILNANPFADPNASPAPDARRFLMIDSVNFLPNPTTSTYEYELSNSQSVTNRETVSYSYTNTIGLSLPILKINNTFTLTNSSTTSNQTGSTSKSSFVLTLPSAPYTGPGTLFVYIDTIYKTFMFSFVP